jgi:hypothetical protein
MKQILTFSLIIFLLVVFGGCSKDSNPVTPTSKSLDPFALWDTASGRIGSAVFCLAAKDSFIFAGTSDSGVYRSSNSGESWAKVIAGLGNLNVHCFLVKDSTILLGPDAGGIYRSTNNGTSWGTYGTGLPAAPVRALAQKDTNLLAGVNNQVYRSTDQGLTWVGTGSLTSTVTSIVVKGSKLIAGTSGSGVFRSTNNGTNWGAINFGGLNTTVYSLVAKDTNIFAATAGGVFRTSNDSSWTAVNDGLYSAFALSPPQSLYAYGSNILVGFGGYAGVYLTPNNGASWISANAGLPTFDVNAFTYNGYYVFIGGRATTGGGVWRHGL